MALNISAFSCATLISCARCGHCWRVTPGVAQQLELEITETALVHSIEGTPDALRLLSRSVCGSCLTTLALHTRHCRTWKHFQCTVSSLIAALLARYQTVWSTPPSPAQSSRWPIAQPGLLVAEGIEHEDQRGTFLHAVAARDRGYLSALLMRADMEVMIATMARLLPTCQQP